MMGSDMDLKNIHIREAKKDDVDQVQPDASPMG